MGASHPVLAAKAGSDTHALCNPGIGDGEHVDKLTGPT